MKALFFDLDGTLIDINQREIEVIHDTANHFGLQVSKATVKQLCVQLPSYTDVFEEVGLNLTEKVIEYWTAAFVKRYHFSTLREGVKSALEALSKDNSMMCVTSRETPAEVSKELKFFGIDELFRHIVTRTVTAEHFGLTSLPLFPYHEQRRKLYQCALAVARSNPGDTVAIGDMGRELRPARELGIPTVGLITYEARKNELQKSADFMISDMTHLPNILR